MATKKVIEKSTEENDDLEIRPVGDIPRFAAMAIYGRAGSGKTSFAATFPKPLILLDIRERGTESIANIDGIDVAHIKRWDQFESIFWKLKNRKPGFEKYKSIVIDHLSAAQALGMEGIRKQENMAPDEMFTKRNWGSLSGKMQTWIENYRNLWDNDFHLCFIAHERATTGEEGLEDQIDPSVGPRLMPSAASYLNGAVSTIGRTFIREIEEEVKVGAKTKTVTRVQFCMRIAPHSIYAAKLRRPVSSEVPLPDIIVNPTFEKIQQLSRGESIKRKTTR